MKCEICGGCIGVRYVEGVRLCGFCRRLIARDGKITVKEVKERIRKMTFNKWLDTLVEEKEIESDNIVFEKSGPSGVNFIPLPVVLEAIKSAPSHEQKGIKTMLVKIDFVNGNIVDYFDHLAGALAI